MLDGSRQFAERGDAQGMAQLAMSLNERVRAAFRSDSSRAKTRTLLSSSCRGGNVMVKSTGTSSPFACVMRVSTSKNDRRVHRLLAPRRRFVHLEQRVVNLWRAALIARHADHVQQGRFAILGAYQTARAVDKRRIGCKDNGRHVGPVRFGTKRRSDFGPILLQDSDSARVKHPAKALLAALHASSWARFSVTSVFVSSTPDDPALRILFDGPTAVDRNEPACARRIFNAPFPPTVSHQV